MGKRQENSSKSNAQQAETNLSVERIINKQLKSEIESRKRLEKELQISEVRFRRLFEAAQDGILILDFYTGRITEANPFLLSLLGYSRSYLMGKRLWEIGVFKDIKASKEIFKELKIKGFVRYENLPLEKRSGGTAQVEFVSNVYTVDHKKVIQCNIRDISERAQLQRMKEAVEKKVYNEIRNPLLIVKYGLNHILNKKDGDINNKQRKILAVLCKAIDRLIRITTELIDFSELETGTIELKKGPINAQNLVKEVVSFHELRAKHKDLEVRLELPEQEIIMHTDKDKMFQVLSNLIGNAVKFTEKGHIKVTVSEKEGSVEFSVSDTGRGISKDDLPKIFHKFEQVGETLKGRDKGIGLGLAIAKDIAELNKGKILVESEFGKGTKFSFSIPKVLAEK